MYVCVFKKGYLKVVKFVIIVVVIIVVVKNKCIVVVMNVKFIVGENEVSGVFVVVEVVDNGLKSGEFVENAWKMMIRVNMNNVGIFIRKRHVSSKVYEEQREFLY